MPQSILLSSLPDTDGSRCVLAYDEAEHWLRATWRGFVDMAEAQRGASNYLQVLASVQCAYLLNDNVALHGPWFDSIEWLQRIWLPQALSLGLRYVAHVVQADTLFDTVTAHVRGSEVEGLELQIFQQVAEAEAWLRSCQRRELS
ncbi:MAG TPA: hypothetical protein VF629_17760 [Hymenobacter sp.]|jgi:hypothetical protein|uniref:hypothetical protein n=1 Tax=Hymenobacter sp. TaxID=1898978 RepID=UPI002ED82CF9